MEYAVTDKAYIKRLNEHLTASERNAVRQLADQLLRRYGTRIAQKRMLVAYGGGKDSTYTVAFLRAVQLHIQAIHNDTFKMRVATMRHAGMPKAVMRNIDRIYRRLGLLGDERVELLVVDHDLIRVFDVDLPIPEDVRAMNRQDILLNGHLSGGDGRPTFCNACNLSVANFFGKAAWYDGGVDAVFTGDSTEEQRSYSKWILRLARRTGVDVSVARQYGFHGLLRVLNEIGRRYHTEIFGVEQSESIDRRAVEFGNPKGIPEFISIYNFVEYDLGSHRDLITGFLGFELDELALSFTESDCANPALMAHLRGLRAERVEGRKYAQGISEYLELAEILMAKKQMPADIQALILKRYQSENAINAVRQRVNIFAQEAFGLREEHWICMVFSPFVDRGERLEQWLGREARQLAPYASDIHKFLGGAHGGEYGELGHALETLSGLSLVDLHSIYGKQKVNFERRDTLMSRIRDGDPHKAPIHVSNREGQYIGTETISGR